MHSIQGPEEDENINPEEVLEKEASDIWVKSFW